MAVSGNTSDVIPMSLEGVSTTLQMTYASEEAFFMLNQVVQIMRWYLPPVVIVFGTFGNTMTVVIMRKMMTSQDSVISLYFVILAVVDLMGLYAVAFRKWASMTLGWNPEDAVLCKVVMWLNITVPIISAWTLVLLTLHRAVSVAWPHKVGLILTKKRALVALSLVACAIGLLYSYVFFGFTLISIPSRGGGNGRLTTIKVCFFLPDYVQLNREVFSVVTMVLQSLLPFLCLALGNAVLIWKLTVSVKNFRSTLTLTSDKQAAARDRAAFSVTLTVVMVSLTFIVLTLPFGLDYYLTFFRKHSLSGEELAQANFLKALAQVFLDTNHAVNFYLYCLTGRRFREEFFKVVCGSRLRCCLRARSGDLENVDNTEQRTSQSEVYTNNRSVS